MFKQANAAVLKLLRDRARDPEAKALTLTTSEPRLSYSLRNFRFTAIAKLANVPPAMVSPWIASQSGFDYRYDWSNVE